MKTLTLSQLQRAHMERQAKRHGTTMEYGEIVRRDAAGRYTVSVRGIQGTGLTTIAGDYGVGDSVRVSRGGPGSISYQIDGGAPASRRANQPSSSVSVAVTSTMRLR